MAGGQWEVVGGRSKKTKQKNGTSRPSKDKKKQDDSPLEASGPICESQTIYNAFLERDKKDPPKQKTNANDTGKNKEKNMQPKKKKDKKSASPAKTSLEDSFSEVTEDDVKNLIATLEVLCPNTPLVRLKDLVSFLNVKLDSAVEDPVFSGKPIGYPSILLNKGVYNLLLKTFSHCSTQILQLFFEYCLQSMVQDTLKGIHTLGYRIVLQCLAQEMPSVATANLSKCVELCSAHHNRQNICLSVMWAAGQAGNNNLEAGFRTWTDLMFPLIGTKTCTGYAVDYLEKLVCSEDLMNINKSIIEVKDMFHILDFIFSKDLVKSVQKRLISFYPTLKALSYGPEPETVLRHYFPSYLRRLDPQCPQALKEEILSSLVYCLEKDARNYSIWRQLYSKHFNQSKMLIAHLNEQWEKLPPKFPKKCLLDTLSVFQVTNEELLSNGKKEPVVEECILINKELLAKINSQMFSWIRAILVVILICSLILLCDILIHESFIESHTGKFMKDAGLLFICTQVGEKLSYYYGKTHRLLEMHVPTLVLWIQKDIRPYFELFWEQLLNTCIYIWNSTYAIRLWCGKYIEPVLIMIDSQAPVYGRWLLSLSRNLKLFLYSCLHALYDFFKICSDYIVLWVQSSEFAQQLLTSFIHIAVVILETLQDSFASLIYIIKSYIPYYT